MRRIASAALAACLTAAGLSAQDPAGQPAVGPAPDWGRRLAEEPPDRPPLMPWQRDLEDALALVEATGKPLLICVNMDGEPASEILARFQYRDPEFVELARGFIPVLASPDDHDPRDRDDRGRRLADSRFGRLIDPEHVDIEPLLFERWFGDQRVAPRHLAVDPEGEVLFDLFLLNDLSAVDEALRQHGVPDGDLPPPGELDERALLASPDAGHRAHLESLFADGDLPTRLRLAGEALSFRRPTQHPEILHMALRDAAGVVRLQAVRTLARNPEQAPAELLVPAFRACCGHPAEHAALVDAVHRLSLSAQDDELRERARRLQRIFSGLQLGSGLVDVDRWRLALAASPRIEEEPISAEEIEPLIERLGEIEDHLQLAPEDRELRVLMTATLMRYARTLIAAGRDPTFLLEDVRTRAREATSPEAPDRRALGYLAWAGYLLNDQRSAVESAAVALPLLIGEAGSPLAAEVLAVLADARTRELYEAMGSGSEWPAGWIADIRSAYEILLDHPHLTESQALAFVRFLDAIEAFGPQAGAIRRALARFPASAALHEHLRIQTLRDQGADALEGAYAALPRPEEHAATLDWFAGLAGLVAAERRAQDRRVEDALAAYGRSVSLFDASIEANPLYGESAAHYVCLAHSGRSRILAEAGELEAATDAIREAAMRCAPSLSARDGLGNAPAGNADLLYRALLDADRAELAESLRELLEPLGVELGRRSRRGGR